MTGPSPSRMLAGRHVYRVVSQLGTDLLVGHCWCGEERSAEDPIELWEWLLAHPETHDANSAAGAAGPPGDRLVRT
ncbi:hypothetical protein [Leekyejoonella antrihumi]|uniref:Uncharacterized protein n=1 Tax=Leekyejoonella antrihumi TaxID=1660198 RepID=A0A563E7J8_9MICO|nr:hypothetical protein [Leekyejoonella antrihumi]TWP38558.1 hypothetical protein FGL98_01835 [Leekyejoonella antrihumi]